jgi:outer membrane receptor protein involved in Fe transport
MFFRFTAMAGAMLAAATAAHAQPNTDADSQSITITGTKRKQSEQEATQSLTVLTQEELANERDAYDALLRLPNITGGARSALPTIRGVDGNGVAYGGGGAVSGGRPRFTTYVDGVARAYSFSAEGNASLWDVKQIEVYRGAQSTTLGRNSGAGAMVITTNDPVFENQAAALIGVRTARKSWDAAAMINHPLGDELALRFTAEGSHGSNWRTPIGAELSGKRTEDLEAQNFERYRLKALWAPSALRGLTLRFTHDDQRDASPNGVDSITGPDFSRREVDASYYAFFVRRNAGTSLQADYEIGGGWTAQAVLARQKSGIDAPAPVAGSATFLDVFANSTERSPTAPAATRAPALSSAPLSSRATASKAAGPDRPFRMTRQTRQRRARCSPMRAGSSRRGGTCSPACASSASGKSATSATCSTSTGRPMRCCPRSASTGKSTPSARSASWPTAAIRPAAAA